MKYLTRFLLAVVWLALLCMACLAQTVPTTLGTLSDVPTTIEPSSTSNVLASVRLQQGKGVAFIPIFVGSNTVSTAVTYTYQLSADNTNWSTAISSVVPYVGAGLLRTNAVNGTTSVVGYHRFIPEELVGARYIRLQSIANASANSIVTNTAIYYSIPN